MRFAIRARLASAALLTVVVLVVTAMPAVAAVPYPETPATTWGADGRVRAMETIGSVAYLGGHFLKLTPPAGSTAVAEPRNRLAAIDLRTGEPTAWNPDANGKVWAVTVDAARGIVYVGGDFTTIGGVSRKKLAAIDATTGQVTSFAVHASAGIRALELSRDGSTLYVGGRFKRIGGRTQPMLAAVSTAGAGSVLTGWDPVVAQVDGPCPPRCTPEVASLALSYDGDQLYVGGHFGSVDGQPRNNAAAVDPTSGAVTPWDPNIFEADPNNPNQRNLVNGIAVPPPGDGTTTDRVYLCGDWWRLGGVRSPNLGAVHAQTGARISTWWHTTDGGTPDCVVSEGYVYVGGHFQKVGGDQAKITGVDRAHLAAIEARDGGVVADWDPGTNSVLGVHELSLALSSSGELMVGGDFTKIGGKRQSRFAVFRKTSGSEPSSGSTATATFTGSGSATGEHWFPHTVNMGSTGTSTAVLTWDDPAADLFLFFRDPTGTTVASDRERDVGTEKVLTVPVEVLGEWGVNVNIKEGEATFTLTVEYPA